MNQQDNTVTTNELAKISMCFKMVCHSTSSAIEALIMFQVCCDLYGVPQEVKLWENLFNEAVLGSIGVKSSYSEEYRVLKSDMEQFSNDYPGEARYFPTDFHSFINTYSSRRLNLKRPERSGHSSILYTITTIQKHKSNKAKETKK
jgi:hypothetical protein